jgi:hypothetical protein
MILLGWRLPVFWSLFHYGSDKGFCLVVTGFIPSPMDPSQAEYVAVFTEVRIAFGIGQPVFLFFLFYIR